MSFFLFYRSIDENSLRIQLPQTSVDSGRGQRRSDRIYEFDHVFGETSTQQSIFTEMQGLITSVLDGYSACIFAYGQTGSGKTYTMEGNVDDPMDKGIIPRTLESLHHEMGIRSSTEFTTTISMIEIYNDKIFDLLGNNLSIEARQNANGEIILPTAVIQTVHSVSEMMTALHQGDRARHVASTASNEHSSRSHMLFILTVKGVDTASGQSSEGRLVLVDLAGSERVAKTESTGQRLLTFWGSLPHNYLIISILRL